MSKSNSTDKKTEKSKSKDSQKKSAKSKTKSKQSSKGQATKKSSSDTKKKERSAQSLSIQRAKSASSSSSSAKSKSKSKQSTKSRTTKKSSSVSKPRATSSSSTRSGSSQSKKRSSNTKATTKKQDGSALQKPVTVVASKTKDGKSNKDAHKEEQKPEVTPREEPLHEDVPSLEVDFSSIAIRIDTKLDGEESQSTQAMPEPEEPIQVEVTLEDEEKTKTSSDGVSSQPPAEKTATEVKKEMERKCSPDTKKQSTSKVKLPEADTAAPKDHGTAHSHPAVRTELDGRRSRRSLNPAAELLQAGPGILMRALKAQHTLTGLPVNRSKVTRMPTLQDEEKKREELKKSSNHRVAAMLAIMEAPFNQISVITGQLGLTGAWGVIAERFEQFPGRICCVINATYEVPLLEVEGIDSYRIPVADTEKEDLSIYFDEVTEEMHDFACKGFASVVHCMAGVSRSSSIVIAYLMRYHDDMRTLELAFAHTKAIRSIVRPNLAFLKQLSDYEKKLHGEQNATPWRQHSENGITKELPGFIIDRYFDDYQHEFESG